MQHAVYLDERIFKPIAKAIRNGFDLLNRRITTGSLFGYRDKLVERFIKRVESLNARIWDICHFGLYAHLNQDVESVEKVVPNMTFQTCATEQIVITTWRRRSR